MRVRGHVEFDTLFSRGRPDHAKLHCKHAASAGASQTKMARAMDVPENGSLFQLHSCPNVGSPLLAPWPQAPQAHAQRLTLEQAIEALPENLKDAFLLGAVHGMDHREIATQLDISPANARARISRARAFLRDWLHKRGGAK